MRWWGEPWAQVLMQNLPRWSDAQCSPSGQPGPGNMPIVAPDAQEGPTIGQGDIMSVFTMQEAVERILHIFTCVHTKAGTGCESNMIQNTEKEKPKCALTLTIAWKWQLCTPELHTALQMNETLVYMNIQGDIQNMQSLFEHGSWPVRTEACPAGTGAGPVAVRVHPAWTSALLTQEKHLQGVVKWKTPVPEQHEECDPLYVNKKQVLKIGITIYWTVNAGGKKAGKRYKAADIVTPPHPLRTPSPPPHRRD